MPTMEEIEGTILSARVVWGRGQYTTLEEKERAGWTDSIPVSQHKLVHIRPEFVDCKYSLLVEAWEQIKRAVSLCAAGVCDPKDHRAEALGAVPTGDGQLGRRRRAAERRGRHADGVSPVLDEVGHAQRLDAGAPPRVGL